MIKRMIPLVTMLVLLSSCTLLQDIQEAAPYPDGRAALAPNFTVITWNVAKGNESSDEEVTEVLKTLSDSHTSAVIALQEATGKMLDLPGRGAHFARSFRWWWGDTDSGVALIAPVAPLTARPITVKKRELGFATPKMGLAAVYPLSGSDGTPHRILMITLHGLNFEISARGLAAQMAAIREVVSAFRGPAVVCGDFNTWSTRRIAVVTEALPGFTEAPVQGGRPGTSRLVALIGGNSKLAIDRIFYRGLHLEGPATAVPTTLSDHVPVMARFTLP
ncbi:endonuclease/exonuclease/phosphatase family protein [Desulfoluna spongiiphila]|uniref:endonuclease/exonuclease/phosphatase family protein n=1 Tax=Desulfoluna spongiiphila TaxID=419481 RepID=UPI001259858B|nr:endonuclease/exonuclease/phosphatase family protein [Desulfoluna spongiiphila]VVS92568.1 endonuclease/exonuclease/phosphatase [Desulfoluna spongiiphila]